jgi:hypothetical protein
VTDSASPDSSSPNPTTVFELANPRITHSSPGQPGPSRSGLSSITIASVIQLLKRLLFDPKFFWALASLVVVADVALTQLIVHFVPCAKSPPFVVSNFSQITFQLRRLTGKLIWSKSKFIWTESETILQSPGRLGP